MRFFVRLLFNVRVVDTGRLPDAPYCLVVNHHSGWDPLLVISVSPLAPRITWFGPKEADLTRGFRNRVINFFGCAIPFDPATSSFTGAARAVRRVFDAGGVLGIFAEGQVGFRETELLPFKEGAVVFATASAVPIVPAAIVGSTYLWLGRQVEIRFGDPIPTAGIRGKVARDALEDRVRVACEALLPDARAHASPLPAAEGAGRHVHRRRGPAATAHRARRVAKRRATAFAASIEPCCRSSGASLPSARSGAS